MPAEKRFLILDDDWAVARILAMMARQAGFDARTTNSHEEFLELAMSWTPTHVAIDLLLPGMGGLAIARELVDEGASAAIILISGAGKGALDSAMRAAKQRGIPVAGVLAKSFRMHTVKALLAALGPGDVALPRSTAEGQGPGSVVPSTPATTETDSEAPVRVMVVAQSVLVRQSLGALLQHTGAVHYTGGAEDAVDAVARMGEGKPDVLLIDATLRIAQAWDAFRIIRAAAPDVGTVMVYAAQDAGLLSMSDDALFAYVERHQVSIDELMEVLKRIGNRSRSRESAPTIDGQGAGRTSAAVWERLSARERQVLDLVVQGKSRADIARETALSPKTPDTYRLRINEKLGVSDVPSLVKIAVQLGISQGD